MNTKESTTNSWRGNLDKLLAKRALLSAQIVEEKKSLALASEQIENTQEAQRILQAIAETIQTSAQRQIAKVVSRCLSAVFEEPYKLKIIFERKRGKTEAEFVYYRNGHRLDPKLTSGGARDVTSLALRLASLVMTMPPARKLLVLDEPWKGLSSENLQKMALLIETLTSELGIQFIIVTHNSELQIGKVIEI
jgi:DNA repair exonuclease SbcCD ATPase subunit